MVHATGSHGAWCCVVKAPAVWRSHDMCWVQAADSEVIQAAAGDGSQAEAQLVMYK